MASCSISFTGDRVVKIGELIDEVRFEKREISKDNF